MQELTKDIEPSIHSGSTTSGMLKVENEKLRDQVQAFKNLLMQKDLNLQKKDNELTMMKQKVLSLSRESSPFHLQREEDLEQTMSQANEKMMTLQNTVTQRLLRPGLVHRNVEFESFRSNRLEMNLKPIMQY